MIFVLNTMDTFSQNKGARTFIKKKVELIMKVIFCTENSATLIIHHVHEGYPTHFARRKRLCSGVTRL